MCKTLWSQDAPFNLSCPAGNYSSGHTPAGCVPLALAQINYFWNFPHWYNYSIMPLNKVDAGGLASNGSQIFEVDFMIRNLGLELATNYNDGGSSTDDANIVPVFNIEQYSSISSTTSEQMQSAVGQDNGTTYSSLLTNEVGTNYRPCIITGFSARSYFLGIIPQTSGDGHCWICDGSQVVNAQITYTNTTYTQTSWGWQPNVWVTSGGTVPEYYLHMNWGLATTNGETGRDGLAASNNAWYECNVNYTQANGGTPNFQYFQVVYYNIQP